MALILTNYVSWNLPYSTERFLQEAKSWRFVGSMIVGIHFSWKILRKLSLCGNSSNPLLKFLHRLLKGYLNHGLMIRSEFSAQIPWQFYLIFGGRWVIVNYGSYGTVPNSVIKHCTDLQKQLEFCPDFFNRVALPAKYEESRRIVAKAIGCNPENLVFTDNITEGMNCTLRSLLPYLKDNEAALCVNLAYSAVTKAITIHTSINKVKLFSLELNFPIKSEDGVCDAFEEMFKKHGNIKLAVFDHITSASATVLPVQKISRICRKYDVISVVDGAHAPGQVFLNVENIGADIYIGNLHKWYYTPKSCAIMYVNPKFHDKMSPSLVSHGCYGNFQERFRRQGTKNYSAHVSAGYAVGDFMESLGGIEHLHQYITPLVQWAVELYKREWGTEELDIPQSMKAPYMRIVYLPEVFTRYYGNSGNDADRAIVDMLDDYQLAIFINPVQGKLITRVSAQIFSSKAEYYYAARCIKQKAKELATKLN